MMSYARYEALKDALRSDLSLQKATVKTDFAVELWRRMEDLGISKGRLAESLGKSAPWVTKVLSGDSNFTIETMIELAEAVDGKLHLHIEPKAQEPVTLDTSWLQSIMSKASRTPPNFARTFTAQDKEGALAWSMETIRPCNDESFAVAVSG